MKLNSYAINSVCIKSDCKFLLIGTKGSDIFEFNLTTNGVIFHNQGHYKGELWGLAVHPSRDCFATAGDDGTVRLWDSRDRAMQKCLQLKGVARALAYNPNGSHIALAMQTGSLLIYSSDLHTIVASQSCGKQWIQTISYSPDGNTLAAGSHDCLIYIFNTNPYSRRVLCKGNSSYITHLDFSTDGKYLQSNSGAYELMFWNTETGKQVTSASAVRDVQWTTWTCTLGWPVQGIWPKYSDGTDIDSCCRSPNGKLLVTGDDFGSVKLFRYPCLSKDHKYKEYKGHSSHVTNISFTRTQNYVISVGGNDKSIFQFKVVT